jgi:GTP-sensing pleiotropic transcriptional regulator CodY
MGLRTVVVIVMTFTRREKSENENGFQRFRREKTREKAFSGNYTFSERESAQVPILQGDRADLVISWVADALGIDRSCVSRTLRFAMLSPKVVHRIVTGDIPPTLTVLRLRESIPLDWEEQESELLGE